MQTTHMMRLAVLGSVLSSGILLTLTGCDGEPRQTETASEGDGQNSPTSQLPNLTTFQTNKSDVLPIDITHVYSIAPYLGEGATNPHQGMHFNFHDDGSFATVGEPSTYPAVYAVDDGIITHVEALRNLGQHEAYGIGLVVGQSNGHEATLYYSLEPFVKEPSPGFYSSFITVHDGQQVHRGDVIGYLFVPPGSTQGTHLHLHLNLGQVNATPALFSHSAIAAMHDKFGDPGGVENGQQLPECTGYKVSASENPFATGAMDCLN